MIFHAFFQGKEPSKFFSIKIPNCPNEKLLFLTALPCCFCRISSIYVWVYLPVLANTTLTELF